jgi:hypothetical protein
VDLCWGEVEKKNPEQLYYYNTSPVKREIEGGESFIRSEKKDRLVQFRDSVDKRRKTSALKAWRCDPRSFSYILNVPPMKSESEILRQYARHP